MSTLVLADTSVWVDHLRHNNARLTSLLDDAAVWCHPFVIGELACGNLRDRERILAALRDLPTTALASDDEVHHLLTAHRLYGSGLGWIDAHLLASARLSQMPLWTLDRTLDRAARKLARSPA